MGTKHKKEAFYDLVNLPWVTVAGCFEFACGFFF